MSNKIFAPFTSEQVDALNRFQQSGFVHPFTCCSFENCDRKAQKNEGVLIATAEGWVCPCGKYKQNWAHEFMLQEPKDPFVHLR